MFNRRIPTLVALFILIVGFLAILFGLTQFQSLISKATPSNMPRDVTFSNFREGTLTVSWTTEEPTIGTILLDKEKKFFGDDRDKDGISRKYTYHHVTISTTTPTADLTILLLSATKYGTVDKNARYSLSVPQNDVCEIKDVPGIPLSCFPFRIKIPSTHGVNLWALGPKNGVVLKSDQITPVSGGLVYFSFANSTIQSTIINPDGTWIMPLSTLMTKDLTSYYQVKPGDIFSLVVHLGSETITFSCNVKDDFSSFIFPPLVVGKPPQC